jgi:hypothetical protein
MNRYQTSTPRVVFGLAAIALTALTLGLAVVVPATMSSGAPEAATVLATESGPPAATEVRIVPGSIEVVGLRESTVAGGAATLPAKRKRQG